MNKKRKDKKFFGPLLPGLTKFLIDIEKYHKINLIDKRIIINMYMNKDFIEIQKYLKEL